MVVSSAFGQSEDPEEGRQQDEVLEQSEASAPKQDRQQSGVGTYVHPWGLPAPGTDINEGLPSSSRPTTDISRSHDGFDLAPGREQVSTVRGSANADAVLGERHARVPFVHTVRQGDTLWDLCNHYFGNPWKWPEVWSYNPEIQNPHWIYPGDQLRLRPGRIRPARMAQAGPGGMGGGSGGGIVPRDTIFLRNYGLIGDARRDHWGKVAGAREDQMLLGEGNVVYLVMRPEVRVEPGMSLTVFTAGRRPEPIRGARRPPGEIVAVQGTVRIEAFDPRTRVARARVTESIDAIERGALVGLVGRRFRIVPPVPSKVDLVARILTGFYPHVHFGRDQLVLIDRGSEDGLAPGNRLLVVRRGDSWRKTLETGGRMTSQRMRTDLPEPARYEDTPLVGDDRIFPDEVVGELRVLSAQKWSSVALVTSSVRELVAGDRVVAQKGR